MILINNFTLNAVTYNETLNRVMVNSKNLSRCKELLNKKNDLFEATPESANSLLVLDELLSDYYGEVLQLMYIEVVENIFKFLYSAV